MANIDEIRMPNELNTRKEPENFNEDEHPNEEDVLKILIATDIHLGYEQTTKRAQEDDSFRTFEEILEYARNMDVDMVLLGGDLFHEAKPPHNVVMKCINLLREYCLSNKPVKIQFLTNPEDVFSHCVHKIVNYEDPNLNVGIPIFSINGNHDDPSFGAIGSMDVLSATGLINYFGKWTDVTHVSIPPIYLKKGATTVALYGLSYMNDQRLSRIMRNHKFELLQSDKVVDPFNIMVLHQNRAQHSQNAFIPEDLLPKFLNLIIWGHEHESMVMPQESKLNPNVFISQPGSSVATSLAHGESIQKKIGILSVYKTKFKMMSLPLKTVRVFVFEDLVLNDHNDDISKYKSRSEAVEEFIEAYIENVLISKAAEQLSGHPKQPLKPLIRLRIFHSQDKDVFDPLKISQKYYNIVANPNDMILFKKCSSKLKKKDMKIEMSNSEEINEIFKFDNCEKDWKRTVIGGMTEYFNQGNKLNKLTVLSLSGLNNALSKFVNANDTKAFEELVEHQIKKTLYHLTEQNLNSTDEILAAIKKYQNLKTENENQNKGNADSLMPMDLLSDKNKNDNIIRESLVIRGRHRGRGRGKEKDIDNKAKETASSTRTKQSRTKSTLDITMDRSTSSISVWKKASQNNSRSASKHQSILLDSDSD